MANSNVSSVRAAEELIRRQQDGLSMIRAIGPRLDPSFGNQEGAFRSQSSECLLRGGNRAGKSLVAATLFASIARDEPIQTWDGQFIETRRPHQKGRELQMWCHDDQTEVLTKSGWKLFVELSDDDLLGTVDLDTDTVEFQRPIDRQEIKSSGQMMKIKGKKLDMLVTTNHRMVVYPDATAPDFNNNKPVIRTANKLRRRDKLKVSAANWNGELPSELPEVFNGCDIYDLAEWIGFYIAEGCCDHSRWQGRRSWKVRITQVKPSGMAYYEDLVSRLPFKSYRSERDYVISSKRLWSYLEPLGNCYSKFVPQWIKDAPQGVIEKFLEGYFAGDGHENSRGYITSTTASKKLADDIQELLLKTKRSASIKRRPPSEYRFESENRGGTRSDNWVICVWVLGVATLRNCTTGKPNYRIENGYSGNVYCATVANGTLITRRNGKPIISGNCIGLKIEHFSTIHRLLFRPGVYKIIKDLETLKWRAWMPWIESDLNRRDECKPSWPLIPHSMVDPKSWSWESKSSRQFTHVTLPGKAEIWCFPSTARDPRQGEPVDVIWIDEAIEYPAHYQEWQMRISDERGRIFWSSWPRRGNPALVELKDRAQEQAEEISRGEREHADVEEFVYVFENNPFIPAEEKRKRKEGMTEEEWQARNYGEFLSDASKIYPFFDKNVHCAVPYDQNLDDEIAKVLRANNGIPPANWTHELVLDPGTTKPCVLMVAVPPPDLCEEDKPVFVIYREIYQGRMTAHDIALKIHEWTPDGATFNRWVIDNQAGRRIPEGFTESIATNYADRFKDLEISCQNPGPASGFHIGNPDFPTRRSKMDEAIRVQESTAMPSLRVVAEHCPSTVYQLTNNQLSVQGDFVLDRPNEREKNDCRVCVEYWIASNPKWVNPMERRSKAGSMIEDLRAYMDELTGRSEQKKNKTINVGPGAAA